MHENNSKLVDAQGLLDGVFDEKARPSMRWLRTQQRRKTIPSVKIGRLVFFDIDAVRDALARKNTIRKAS